MPLECFFFLNEFLSEATKVLEANNEEWHLCDPAKTLYTYLGQSGHTDLVPIAYYRICEHCRAENPHIPQQPETITAYDYAQREDYETAVSIFEQVLEKDSGCIQTLNGYWWSLDEVGRIEEAIEIAKKVFHHQHYEKLLPENLCYNIGYMCGTVGQLGQAATYYKHQLDYTTYHCQSLENLSFIQILEQDLVSAEDNFNQSLRYYEKEVEETIENLKLTHNSVFFLNPKEVEEFTRSKISKFESVLSLAKRKLGSRSYVADVIAENKQGDVTIGASTSTPKSKFSMADLVDMMRNGSHDGGQLDNVVFQVEMEKRGDYSILVQQLRQNVPNFDKLPTEAQDSIIEAEHRMASSDSFDYAPVIVGFSKSFEICLYEMVFNFYRQVCQKEIDIEKTVEPIFTHDSQQTKKVRAFASFLKGGKPPALDAMHMALNFCNGSTAQKQEIIGRFKEFILYRIKREQLLNETTLDNIQTLKRYRNPAAHSQTFTFDQAKQVQSIVFKLIQVF